jgi:pilus assembly protein CpaE
MNEQAVAYSFALLDERGATIPRGGGACGRVGGRVGEGKAGGDTAVTLFTSSERCRATLRSASSTTSVIVRNGVGTVSAINLAAALCTDEPERDVYLLEERPTDSLAGRARAAGIRGIINGTQAESLLAIDHAAPVRGFDEGACVEIPGTDVFLEGVGYKAGATIRPLPELAAPDTAESRIVSAVVSDRAGMPAVPPTVAGPASEQGRVVGFFSGRGGVGKSTVALMAAFAAQRRGGRVALVDLDLQFGDMGYLAGREASSHIQRLPLTQLCGGELLPALSDEALTLIVAPDRPEQGEQLVSLIPRLLGELAAQRDLVVINTGSFWTDAHAQAAQRCDHLVFLMDQRATSIEACKQAVDLCLRMQIPQARFHYLLNGCGRHAALTAQDVSFALGGVEVCGLADGGSLVDELLALGCPLELLASGNAFVASLEGFLDRLAGGVLAALPPDDRADERARRGEGRGAKIFNLAALRGFFGEARHVAP